MSLESHVQNNRMLENDAKNQTVPDTIAIQATFKFQRVKMSK